MFKVALNAGAVEHVRLVVVIEHDHRECLAVAFLPEHVAHNRITLKRLDAEQRLREQFALPFAAATFVFQLV